MTAMNLDQAFYWKPHGPRQAGLIAAGLDLDNFKSVNDRDGHDAGDRVLRTLAETLQTNVRSTDVAARRGGDEFAISLPETGNFGVATFMTPPKSIDVLMKQADKLMYDARQKRKNSVPHEVVQTRRESTA